MIKLAITNEKGGCGKTTTAVNVASILAERGYRVLLIDSDMQSHSSYYMQVLDSEKPSLADVFMNGISATECIAATDYGFEVLRNDPVKSELLEDYLKDQLDNGEEEVMYSFVNAMKDIDEDSYDIVIIDTPPSKSRLYKSIHVYTEYMIIPMSADQLAYNTISQKLATIQEIRYNFNPQLTILGSAIMFYDIKSQTQAAFREVFNDEPLLKMFETCIRYDSNLRDAINQFEPINFNNRRVKGYQDYKKLVTEIVERLGI